MACKFVSVDPHDESVTFIRDGGAIVVTYTQAVGSPILSDCLPRSILSFLCRALADPKINLT